MAFQKLGFIAPLILHPLPVGPGVTGKPLSVHKLHRPTRRTSHGHDQSLEEYPPKLDRQTDIREGLADPPPKGRPCRPEKRPVQRKEFIPKPFHPEQDQPHPEQGDKKPACPPCRRELASRQATSIPIIAVSDNLKLS